MTTLLKLGHNVRNWTTFEVTDEITPEQRALLEAAADDTGDEALELAQQLEDSGVLKFITTEREPDPWLWGNDDTGVCANILDVYDEED